MSKNFEKTLGWYREMLGFRCSDEFYAGEKSNVVGSFNRLDRGDDYVDHHAFFCIRGDKSGLNHLSYEAADIDDVMIGHEHLQTKGYEHMWGIGRHLIGSQLFDYWADPWGRVHEHWADTDVLNAHTPPNLLERGAGTGGHGASRSRPSSWVTPRPDDAPTLSPPAGRGRGDPRRVNGELRPRRIKTGAKRGRAARRVRGRALTTPSLRCGGH